MKSSSNSNKTIINSVDRTLDIILYIYEKAAPVRITDISRDLGIYKSTVFRSLQTLVNKGFAEKNNDNDTYWLGMKFFTIGSLVQENIKIDNILAPYAQILHDEFGEVVNVCTLDTTTLGYPSVLTISKIESASQILKANPSVGRLSDCHNSSAGKCLLAFSSNILDNDYEPFPLKKTTQHTITNWDDFLAEIRRTRQEYYALDDNEYELGLTCIGSPILDKNGIAIATLSIAGPTLRIRNDFQHKIERVIEVSKLASNKFL